ncbi:MAG: glycine zipper 2TM domain-containing protein [Betaproteobacteria bacterium]|nr:glycine zipper 2TM domain-containing protein [Betaproteobacteria bacterium]
MLKLKQGGVSEAVIQRILAKRSSAAIGGLLGYAVAGRGNHTAGTVVGAAGGAVAGNVIENRAPEGRTFEIGLRFDDGSSRVFVQESHPAWQQGSRVKLVNGALAPL